LPHTFQIRSQNPGGTTVAERRSPSQRVLQNHTRSAGS